MRHDVLASITRMTQTALRGHDESAPTGNAAYSHSGTSRRQAAARWGLAFLAEDAETIVGEFVANAVTHASASELSRREVAENLGLRLVRRTGEVICAVLDPSDAAPVLRAPGSIEESGRGLQMVDALSDVWGWSPVAGRGKAVWAILFCA
jgi:anti-sigma regulatory factor (Ser/Thr protein kinase)